EKNEFSNINDVLGKLLVNPVVAGQSIRRDNVRDPGLAQRIPTAEPGQAQVKAYPILVDSLSGVADQVAINDFVDVIATFAVDRQIIRPSASEQVITVNDVDRVVRPYEYGETQTFFTTKTIIQRAQVLQIVRPATPPPAEGEGTGGAGTPTTGGPPAVDATGQPIGSTASGASSSTLTEGNWVVVLALTDQEIELIEFAAQSGARIVLALRGSGDAAIETTSGVTLDLLVREFGLPLPQPLPPRVYSEAEVFTPQPTPTPRP
ncbi:MAG: pilus assembly protein CpaB, partial [Chloroflexus sp.]